MWTARRMRSKTPPPRWPPNVMVGAPDFDEEEDDESARNMSYLVTLPHPKQEFSSAGVKLVAPESLTKQAVLEAFLSACAEPNYVDARSIHRGSCVAVKWVGVWRENHKALADKTPHAHDHLPVLAKHHFRFLPVKRALLLRFGLASHWSCTHLGYWSAVRYVAWPSEKKPQAALDPKPVLWPDTHPPVSECVHEPLTASALRARREKADRQAAEDGESAPRITELDVWPLVVKNKFRDTTDVPTAHLELMAFSKTHCSAAMHAFLFKHRARLSTLIEDIWRWENAEDVLAIARQSRMEAMHAAVASPCVCGGAWLAAVTESFIANRVPVQDLCCDIVHALRSGRGERTPVVVLAGRAGGEGKSIFLKPLCSVFGDEGTFMTPSPGNFPLLGIQGRKVAFLDEWRFNESILPYATQCLWYDGSAVPVARPQNQPGVTVHLTYRGTAPVFVTTKLADVEDLRDAARVDPRTGKPASAEASMLCRRLKVYELTAKIGPPSDKIEHCARCFAQLVLTQAAVSGRA